MDLSYKFMSFCLEIHPIIWEPSPDVTQRFGNVTTALDLDLFDFEVIPLPDYFLCVVAFQIYTIESTLSGSFTIKVDKIFPNTGWNYEFVHDLIVREPRPG